MTVKTFGVHSGQAWDLELFTNKSDVYVLRCIDRTLLRQGPLHETRPAFSAVLPSPNKHLTYASVWPRTMHAFALWSRSLLSTICYGGCCLYRSIIRTTLCPHGFLVGRGGFASLISSPFQLLCLRIRIAVQVYFIFINSLRI